MQPASKAPAMKTLCARVMLTVSSLAPLAGTGRVASNGGADDVCLDKEGHSPSGHAGQGQPHDLLRQLPTY